MQNINEIREEAKREIIEVLKMCNCYTYTEKGIEQWLDVWEKACSPQIEAIAEKSPYYDGKCKIVFPSEFPRELDEYGINNFCSWLRTEIIKNIKPAIINGLTCQQASDIKRDVKIINNLLSYKDSIRNITENKESLDILIEEYLGEEFRLMYIKAREAWEKFEYEIDVKLICNQYYFEEDLQDNGYMAAIKLASILSQSYAKKQFLTDELVNVLKYNFSNCRFSVGQKLSRAVNNIASKYGIAKHPNWNKEFAKYADAINPLTVTKWTIFSWHPVDYLTFCFGNCWSTCSNIDKHNNRGVKIGASRSSITSYVNEDYVFRGEHSSACLSYMFDKTSFVYYTVNHSYDGKNYEMQDKESRIIFSLNEDMDTLLQTRLYPQCNDDNPNDNGYTMPREIIQKVIADALEVPNLWKIKKGREVCCEYAMSVGVHYADYADERNKNCNISWRGDSPKRIKIGHDAICPNCKQVHTRTVSLNCSYCDPEEY